MTAVLLMGGMLGSATLGGVYFTFSSFVMKALARLPGSTGAEAMQQINIKVLNPGFLGLFFGTAVPSLGAVVRSLVGGESAGMGFTIAGAVLYARWTFWNHVRTVASPLAALAFAVALVYRAGS